MIIAFWGINQGKNGTTTNMVATAIASSLCQANKVLLLDSSLGNHTVQESFGDCNNCMLKESYSYYHGEGIDYLIHRSKYKMLNKRTAEEGILSVQKNLAYIPESGSNNRDLYEMEFGLQCEKIISCLGLMADYIFVDCRNGCNKINKRLLQAADIVVVNLSQEEKELDDFFQLRTFFHDKMIYLIGNYEEDSLYNVQKICHLYRIGQEKIGIIPYNSAFIRALKKGRALQFFKSPQILRQSILYGEFHKEVYRAADMILKNVEYLKRKEDEYNG